MMIKNREMVYDIIFKKKDDNDMAGIDSDYATPRRRNVRRIFLS